MIQANYLRTGTGAVLSDAALSGDPNESWFHPESWQAGNSVVGQAGAGRGSVWFLDSADGVWALRHYCRGGLVARLIDDHYLWLGEERTRSFREWRLLAELCELGLPVPAPVAARYQRRGPCYRADLITSYIADAPSFETLFLDQRLTDSIWYQAGQVVRRFHDAGVYHADLNIRNMLVRADGEIFLLDFDKGRRRPAGTWAQQNLARLERSLRKICLLTGAVFDPRGWQLLLEGYAAD